MDGEWFQWWQPDLVVHHVYLGDWCVISGPQNYKLYLCWYLVRSLSESGSREEFMEMAMNFSCHQLGDI